MHELLLFAQIPPSHHAHLLSIFAGVAAMQPQPFLERHLVFKPARAPGSPVGGVGGQLTQPARSVPPIQGISVPPTQPGISAGPTGQGLPAAGSGGQGGSVPPGMMADGALQAFQAQTKGDTFYVQLIGRLRPGRQGKGGDKNGDGNRDGSGEETNPKPEPEPEPETQRLRNPISAIDDHDLKNLHTHAHAHEQPNPVHWTLQFRDLPEVPGRRPVVSRLVADYPVQTTDPVAFMAGLGYIPTTTFHISGYSLTHLSTLFTLSHFLLGEPSASIDSTPLLDPSLTSLLTLSLRVQDGNKPELLTRGITELVALKELLKGVVELGLGGGERLSLDSRVR